MNKKGLQALGMFIGGIVLLMGLLISITHNREYPLLNIFPVIAFILIGYIIYKGGSEIDTKEKK